MTIEFNERTDTISPSSARITLDRGQSTRVYPVPVATAADLYNLPIIVLGNTNYSPSNDTRLVRQLPLADPVYTSYFAESFDQIRGEGKGVEGTGNQEVESPLIAPNYAQYPYVDCNITFTSRPYSLLPNASISVLQGGWYPDVNQDSTATYQAFNYNNEWTRYTEVGPLQPTNDFLTQQTGLGMSFADVTVPGTIKNPSAKPFGNILNMRIPNFKFSIIIHQLPLRFVTSKNSFVSSKGWQNRVNQNPIQLPFNGPGDYIPPGCLLYDTFTYTNYNMVTGRTWNVYGNGSNSERFIDLKLDFLYTTRKLPTGVTYTAPTNLNYVVGGFNLQPWNGTRGLFWYATDRTSPGDNRPAYASAPLELLFGVDPDSPQQGAIG